MKDAPPKRQWYFALLMLSALGFAPPPVSAAEVTTRDGTVVMHDDGFAFPSFLFSAAQQRARDVCENELPECRDSVRRELATEKAITRMLPWVLLCLAIWIAVRYAQRREKMRERRRQHAARHHVRTGLRAKEARPGHRAVDDNTDDDQEERLDDGLGLGAPGGKPHRTR